MSDKTDGMRENLRWAKPRIHECESLAAAFRLFHEIKDRGIRDSIVGQLLLMRLGEFGLETYSFAYAEVEEYFGFKTVWDYHAERKQWAPSSTQPSS